MKKIITIFEPLTAFKAVGYPSNAGVQLGNVPARFYCLCNSFSPASIKFGAGFFYFLKLYYDLGICFASKRIAGQPKKVFFNT